MGTSRRPWRLLGGPKTPRTYARRIRTTGREPSSTRSRQRIANASDTRRPVLASSSKNSRQRGSTTSRKTPVARGSMPAPFRRPNRRRRRRGRTCGERHALWESARRGRGCARSLLPQPQWPGGRRLGRRCDVASCRRGMHRRRGRQARQGCERGRARPPSRAPSFRARGASSARCAGDSPRGCCRGSRPAARHSGRSLLGCPDSGRRRIVRARRSRTSCAFARRPRRDRRAMRWPPRLPCVSMQLRGSRPFTAAFALCVRPLEHVLVAAAVDARPTGLLKPCSRHSFLRRPRVLPGNCPATRDERAAASRPSQT